MKATITKIKLQLKDRSIELTADEAREVQAELNKLFKMEAVKVVRERLVSYPVYQPIIINRPEPVWPKQWDFWSTTSTGIAAESIPNSGILCMSIGGATN